MKLNARHLILDLMLATSEHTLTAREAILACRIFDISENSVRVALVRLSAEGLIEGAGRGSYRLAAAALELAATIAAKSPVSTRMGKHTLNVIEDMSLRDGYRYEQDMTALIGKTEDAAEAQAAFREKRAPVFKGR